MSWSGAIPLRRADGSIRAFTMVDLKDYARFSRLRWCIDNRATRYVGRRKGGRTIYLHRAIFGLSLDDPRRIDHINGDPLDNRRANLRLATDAQNAQNQGSRGGSSRHRGVTWDRSRGKWMAAAMLDGRHHTIGRFDSEEEAHRAVSAWRAQHMPFSEDARAAA